jgi:tetratricopeptide (TPR) repeat protein
MPDHPAPPLTLDEAREALPAVDELRPLMDQLLASSRSSGADEWAGSALLETAGSRIVDPEVLRAALPQLVSDEQAHLVRVQELSAEVIDCLAAGERTGAALALLKAAALEEARDRAEKAEQYADSACRVLRDEGDPVVRARALRRRGRARRAVARYAEAEADYLRAFDASEAVGDLQGAAEAAIGTGNLLEDQGRWPEAQAWYERALKVLSRDSEPRPERWHASLNLHVVLRAMGALDESLPHLERAEQVAADLADASAAQFIENARGQWFVANEDFERAQDRFWAALRVASSARSRVTIRMNLAEALLGEGRRLEAAQEARAAELEAIRGRISGLLPEVYRLLGRLAAEEGNADAFVLFERALETIRRDDLPAIEQARTLDAYADAEMLVGEATTAADLRAKAAQVFRELGVQAHPMLDSQKGSTDS